MATLYTFGPSHFCEKARWSLDLSGVCYREVRWIPGPHVMEARRISAASTVPILRCADGIVQGSSHIMDWLDAAGRSAWRSDLSDAEGRAVAEIEQRSDRIGVAVRRLVYATGLSSRPGDIARQLSRGADWRRKLAARVMWPVARRIMMKGMRAAARDIPEATVDVERELDHFDAVLGDGRRFLVGDGLTRADIALASLVAPIADPLAHPVYAEARPWPRYRQIIDAYRDRPTMGWACRLYDDFRRPQGEKRESVPG